MQGDAAEVAALLTLLDRGPRLAKVVRFDKDEREPVADEVEFVILR